MGTWLADLAGILHRARGLAAPPLPSLGMEPEDGVPLRRRVGAAGIAACVSAVVVNPLDVVKTRIQAQAFNPHVSAATPFRHVAGSGAGAGTARDLPRPLRIALASGCPPRCPTTGNPSVTRRLCAPECNVYASSLDVVRKIVRQEGPLALFRGTAVALAIAVPTVGIYLPCYDICLANARAALAANDATKPWVGVAPALAGAASRTLAVLCVAPLDLARTRAQAFRSGGAKTPTGAVGVRVSAAVSLSSGGVSALNRSAGLSALRGAWTGTAPTLARDVPYSALYWFALERLRDDLSARGEAVAGRNLNANERLGVNFASGVVAGGGVAALTTPLDVVKTRAQIRDVPAVDFAGTRGVVGARGGGAGGRRAEFVRGVGAEGCKGRADVRHRARRVRDGEGGGVGEGGVFVAAREETGTRLWSFYMKGTRST